MSRGRLLNQDDDHFIIANWEIMSNLEMAKKLGVNPETVSRRGGKLGLINKKGVASGNYERTEISKQITEYMDSIETTQELEGRKKTLELKRIAEQIRGKDKLRIKFKTGETNSKPRMFEGKIIQQNDVLVALKLGNYVESFKYIEFYTGRAVIM